MAESLQELKAALQDAGWRFGKKPLSTLPDQCDWYAWLPNRPKDWPDCECNDKPPSFLLTPSVFELSGLAHARVEFDLCGEMHGRWFSLKLYSVQMGDALATVPNAIEQLGAAWKAIAAVKEQT